MFFKQKKSITVRSIDGNLYITNDERFQGSNQCLDCKFYPCMINKWYGKRKKIENCKLWNKFEPYGSIIDQR